jgi:hypothetical protein
VPRRNQEAGQVTITITPTDQISMIGGARCRVWVGVTERGNKCFLYTAGVSANEDDRAAWDELTTALTPNPDGNAEASAAVAALVWSLVGAVAEDIA